MTKRDKKAKMDKILRSAAEEFAEKGFQDASTNQMMEKAGVSKGLLFHYYGNKKKLFVRCAEIALDAFDEHIMNCIEENDKDLFQLFIKIAHKKFVFLDDNPQHGRILTIMNQLRMSNELDCMNPVWESHKEKIITKILDTCDKTMFRRDIDDQFLIQYIFDSFEVFSLRAQKQLDSLSFEERMEEYRKIEKQFVILIDLLRHGIYD